MNDKGIYKQFGAKKYHGNPVSEYLIACEEQREQKADVEKRETDQELLKRRKVIK